MDRFNIYVIMLMVTFLQMIYVNGEKGKLTLQLAITTYFTSNKLHNLQVVKE